MLIERRCILKHSVESYDIFYIPVINRLIEFCSAIEHVLHSGNGRARPGGRITEGLIERLGASK